VPFVPRPGSGFPDRGFLLSSSSNPFPAIPPAILHPNLRTVAIKANLGYLQPHPATVRLDLLRQLIAQITARAPQAHIHVLEGVTFPGNALDSFRYHGLLENPEFQYISLHDTDDIPTHPFPIPQAARGQRHEFQAPRLLLEADLLISVAPFKRTILQGSPLISATLKNLFGLLPRSLYSARSPHSRGLLHRPNVHVVIQQLAATLSHRFHLGIVDLHQWYDSPDWRPDRGRAIPAGMTIVAPSLLEADLAACDLLGIPPSGYLSELASVQHNNA
jgi:hypothetical protein